VYAQRRLSDGASGLCSVMIRAPPSPAMAWQRQRIATFLLLFLSVADAGFYGQGRAGFAMPGMGAQRAPKQPSPESSLSSYDQRILAQGPPGGGDQPGAVGPTGYGSSAGGYVYPYPTGGYPHAAPSPPAHVPSIYTTTYISAAAAGEAAAERAMRKMRAKALPNPFAPLQQLRRQQQQQQQAGKTATTHLGGTVTSSALTPEHEGAVAVHLKHDSRGLNPAIDASVSLAKKLAKSAAHAKRVRRALAREAARAVKAEQAATLGGIYQPGSEGAQEHGPPVLSKGMTLIFVTITVGAIVGVIWYMCKPERKEPRTYEGDLFVQSSQQYV
jgi:hypothetical protein